MFFRKEADIQRLNLEVPKPGPSPVSPTAPVNHVDPAKLAASERKAKEILDSGRIPESLFVCSATQGLLMFQSGPDQKPAMLLFSSTFAASDYLRATGVPGTVGELKVEALPALAQSWLSLGVQAAILDRCPRCPQYLAIDLAGVAQWTKDDFAKAWAHLRATRLVLGEIRVRSAMNHLSAGSHAAARSDLEYVRDHFDCGIPYLHQMIGLLAGIQQDEPAKAAAMERLREFGPQFEGPLDSSPKPMAVAMVGLLATFGIIPLGAGSK